jgi:hypothetical protein
MKDIIIYSLWLIGSFGLIITSALMAFKGVAGWGWFLFVGIILVSAFSYEGNDKIKGGQSNE